MEDPPGFRLTGLPETVGPTVQRESTASTGERSQAGQVLGAGTGGRPGCRLSSLA